MDETTGSTTKVIAAFVRAQALMKSATKDSTNPHFNSKFADLASVMEALREPLAKSELAVMQDVAVTADGVSVTTKLLHSSGEMLVSSALVLPVAQRTPQGIGSACTYCRRYSLATFLGVVADSDDDGNAASTSTHPPAPAGTKALADVVAGNSTLRQHPNIVMGKIGSVPGAKLADLTDDQVSEYRDICKRAIANPEKAKFHETERQRLEIFSKELTYRGLPVE